MTVIGDICESGIFQIANVIPPFHTGFKSLYIYMSPV